MSITIRSKPKYFAHYFLFSFIVGIIFFLIMVPLVNILTNSTSTAFQVRVFLGVLSIPILFYSFMPYIDYVIFQELVEDKGILDYRFGCIRGETVKVKISDLICIKTVVTPWMRMLGCRDVYFVSKGVDLFCFKGMSLDDVERISELIQERISEIN